MKTSGLTFPSFFKVFAFLKETDMRATDVVSSEIRSTEEIKEESLASFSFLDVKFSCQHFFFRAGSQLDTVECLVVGIRL